MDDQEPSWQRQLLVGLGVLLAIAVLLGGIGAVIAVKAADYAGIGGGSGSSSPEPILPSTGDVTKGPPTPPPSTTTTTTKPPPSQHAITLKASPPTAASYQRVNLTGRYPGQDGISLQVQRRVGDGAWADFPTDAHVRNGAFATYIQTGMSGVNQFRMLDQATGKTSNVANVLIG